MLGYFITAVIGFSIYTFMNYFIFKHKPPVKRRILQGIAIVIISYDICYFIAWQAMLAFLLLWYIILVYKWAIPKDMKVN
jgi:hypothetical protein